MPWCPKCKTEYKDGITTCADCNVALVDSLDNYTEEDIDVYTVGSTSDKNLAIRLAKYLKYSGIGFVYIEADKAEAAFHVNVASEEKKEAIKYYDAFCQVEESDDDTEAPDENTSSENTSSEQDSLTQEETLTEEDDIQIYYRSSDDQSMVEDSLQAEAEPVTEEEDLSSTDDIIIEGEDEEFESVLSMKEDIPETFEDSPANKKTYVKKEDQYKDLNSSVSIFLLFGSVGMILVALNAAGVFHFINGVLSYAVMTIMFAAFLILGITSARKAKIVKSEIKEEQEFTLKINDWLDQHFEVTTFDEPEWKILSNEMLYFKRVNKMKQMITKGLGEIDPAYLDMVVEEYYDKHYTE